MMDIVGLFKEKIEQWQEQSKCDLCWEYSAPIRISDVNEYQQREDECCVFVFLTNIRKSDPNIVPTMGYKAQPITHYATVYFVMKDSIDINVYNEIKGHPISESKWETILKPIQECISTLDFCDINPYIEIVNRNETTQIDWLDMNYTGWKVDITLRELPS